MRQKRSRETSHIPLGLIQVFGLGWSSRDGEKWINSECALEVEPQDVLEDYVESLRGKEVKNHIRLKCAGEAYVSEGDMGLE